MLPLPSGPTETEGMQDGFSIQARDVGRRTFEPATLNTAVPNWRAGDTIPLGQRALFVIGKRDDDADQPPVLVVERVEG